MPAITLANGLNLIANKEFESLHARCIAAIKEDVSDAVPYFLLGVLAGEHGNFAKAVELFSQAEQYDPLEAYYPIYLAKTWSTLKRQQLAKEAADRGEAVVADDAYLLDTLAVVYSRAGFHELAIPLFKRAIDLSPNQANMQYNLGASAQFVGDFSLAEAAYLSAIEINPNFYRAWASLVFLKKQTPEQNSLNKLKRLFEHKQDDADAKLQLGHAIAKTYEDLGKHKTSFDWLLRAKESKKVELPYDRKSGAATFNAAKRTYLRPAPTSNTKGSSHGVTPIFIVGLPRTGTTLVDRILSSHSQVCSAGELNLFAELIKSTAGTNSNLVLDADTLRRANALDLSEIGDEYLSRSHELARGRAYMVDKMPLNFFYCGLILRCLPQAKIVTLRRGALDSCVSNFRQLFSTQHSFYNYTFDLSDTAWFYQQFDSLMTHWQKYLPQDQFTQVHYEQVVFDQESQTRRLLEFCGLEWETACLNFHENKAPVSTASSIQVRQPLYSGSIGRWQKYGEQLTQLKTDLGELAAGD